LLQARTFFKVKFKEMEGRGGGEAQGVADPEKNKKVAFKTR
jgi:hypothetical protein